MNKINQKVKNIIFTTIESIIGLFIFSSILIFPLLFALKVIKWSPEVFILTFLFITFSLIFIEVIVVLVAKLQYKFTIDDWKQAQNNALRSGIFDKMTFIEHKKNILDFKEKEIKQELEERKQLELLKDKYGSKMDVDFFEKIIKENEEMKERVKLLDKIEEEIKQESEGE